MQYIPAYCSLSYLDTVTHRSLVDFVNPENTAGAHTQINLLDLITKGLMIKTDERFENIDEMYPYEQMHLF